MPEAPWAAPRSPASGAEHLRVPYFQLHLSDEDIAAVVEVMRSGWIGQGPKTAAFEDAFARHQGGGHAVATNCCTSALHATLAALGTGPGDGVLVATHAWVSAAEAVANCGALPIFVDCDPAGQFFDPQDAALKLARARAGDLPGAGGRPVPVKGLIAVHYAGLIGDETGLRRFADAEGLWFLADAAHGLTAQWADETGMWRPCGAGPADVYCYSFYPNKTITTGDGGMIVTRDAALAERMRRIRNHGLSFDTWEGETLPSWDRRVTQRGYKYTMTDMAAAFGLSQLSRADAMAARRRAIAALYREALGARPDLCLMPDPADRRSSHHLFPVRLAGRGGGVRNDAIDLLRAQGIDCRVHWRPLHLQPWFRDLGWRAADCPRSSASWGELVSLPIFPAMTDAQVGRVIEVLTAVLETLPGPSDDRTATA